MNILQITQNFIKDMNKTNSTLDKKEVLKKYPEMKELLHWIYNPFKQFYITSEVLKKKSDIIDTITTPNLFSMLSLLSERIKTGHEAIGLVNGFIKNNEQYKDVIYKIIDKDLECRIGVKAINEIYPNLVPEFEVSLCQKYNDVVSKVDIFDGSWLVSHKLDGLRLVTIIDENGNIRFYSRQGKEFETLDVLKEDIKKLNLKSKVIDGEICVLREDGQEDFQGIIQLARRKNFTIPNPIYLTFDMIDYDDFFNKKGNINLFHIFSELNNIVDNKYEHIKVLEQTRLQSKNQFESMIQNMRDLNWEGLILRRNVPYEGKRTNNMLKFKDMMDQEYEVLDIEVGPFRIVEDNKEVTVEILSAVKIKHKGYDVSVGSGFTIEQRKMFYKDPSKIVGHKITVQYFEESKDKSGNLSLRFPVFKAIRDMKE